MKVMAAWDAHRKKVEESLGLEEGADVADRRPTMQTTTSSSAATFQLFGRCFSMVPLFSMRPP